MIHVLKLLAGLLVPVCYIYAFKFLKLTHEASKDRHFVAMYYQLHVMKYALPMIVFAGIPLILMDFIQDFKVLSMLINGGHCV